MTNKKKPGRPKKKETQDYIQQRKEEIFDLYLSELRIDFDFLKKGSSQEFPDIMPGGTLGRQFAYSHVMLEEVCKRLDIIILQLAELVKNEET